MRASFSDGQRGFTLIEILVVITIMGIVFAFAAPAIREFTQNNRQAVALNRFIGFLNYARSEAVKRGATVTVCKSAGVGAAAACGGAGVNWEDGWLVYQDDNGDGTVDGGEVFLRSGEPLTPSFLTMRGAGPVVNRVTFTSRGYSNNAGTFRVCDARGVNSAKGIRISTMGRITRAVDGPDADIIIESAGGVNVACP